MSEPDNGRYDDQELDELAFNANVALPEAQERFQRAEDALRRVIGAYLRWSESCVNGDDPDEQARNMDRLDRAIRHADLVLPDGWNA